jgi:hypothetical protein
MSAEAVAIVVEPFVRRGLFASTEQAVVEMAREYVLGQIERQRSAVEELQAKYGMTYDQFNAYLQARSATLSTSPNQALNEAIMLEEDDALDWKIAREILQSWLGLQSEISA